MTDEGLFLSKTPNGSPLTDLKQEPKCYPRDKFRAIAVAA
jgi:hypothetical protein